MNLGLFKFDLFLYSLLKSKKGTKKPKIIKDGIKNP